MFYAVAAFLVLLLCATNSVIVTGADAECVSKAELSAVKAEMEGRIDQLHSQLQYWQNVTTNTLNEHCSPLTTGPASSVETGETVLVSTVFNITHNSSMEERVIRDVLRKELSHLVTPGYTPYLPASSCKEILQLAPQSPSGLYWLRGTENGPQNMYCDMERSCKGVAGGWMRVASINMNDTSSTCPSGLRTLTSPRRLCSKNFDGDGCSSAVLPVKGVVYSQVCGKIIGYQKGSPDAFHPHAFNSLDKTYVDGISLTHGTSPRKHIWTFAVAIHENNTRPESVCPCTNERNTPPPPVPSYVGDDYFCDTGSEDEYKIIFYGDDPLWDGAGCGEYNTCCDFNSPPWFRKEISPPTSDDVEIRLCTNQNLIDEDINFEVLELYVQ